MKKKIIIDITASDFDAEECERKFEEDKWKIDEEGNPYYEIEVEDVGEGEDGSHEKQSEGQNLEQEDQEQEGEGGKQDQEQESQDEDENEDESEGEGDNQEQEDEPEKDKKKAEFDTDKYIKPKNYDMVLTAIKNNLNPLLIGPAGTGKTRMCYEIAKELGLDFYSESAVTDEFTITGFIDANGNYKESNFYKAFTQGGLFCFDELDGSDPNACIKFNAAIANGYCIFPCGMKYAHKDFRVVATANTFGNGADMQYVGRNQLDAATLDRFMPKIMIDYEKKIENKLTDDNKMLDFVREFRKGVNAYSILKVVSYRAIKAMDKLKDEKAFNKVELVKTCLTVGLDKQDLNNIKMKMGVLNDNEYMEAFDKIIKNA